MKSTAKTPGSQPAFTCAGCAKRHTFTVFAASVFNETMAPGEAAPVCESCVMRAQGSRKVRRRIERAVRAQRGAERVVMFDAAAFGPAAFGGVAA